MQPVQKKNPDADINKTGREQINVC